ncbi:MAG: virulence factor [Planctomycetota bacterium]|nr:virulence factor [Planctomycetota bacterium]
MTPAALSSMQSPLLAAAEAQAQGGRPMYAIAFDMDTEQLRTQYPNSSWNNAYSDIRKILSDHGFKWQQGSVYFGGPEVNAVTCVMAAMDLARSLPWFASSIRDIRMMRIEEFNDLMPAVRDITGG